MASFVHGGAAFAQPETGWPSSGRPMLRLGGVAMPYIFSEMAESIGTITLDHDHRRNALSRALVEEVVAATTRRASAHSRRSAGRCSPASRSR